MHRKRQARRPDMSAESAHERARTNRSGRHLVSRPPATAIKRQTQQLGVVLAVSSCLDCSPTTVVSSSTMPLSAADWALSCWAAAADSFSTGGILLRNTVHLTNRSVDLLDALRLFIGCGRDIAQQVGHLADVADNRVQGLGGAVGYIRAVLGAADRFLNQGGSPRRRPAPHAARDSALRRRQPRSPCRARRRGPPRPPHSAPAGSSGMRSPR